MLEVAIARADELTEDVVRTLIGRLPLERARRAQAYLRPVDATSCVAAFALLQRLWAERSSEPMPPVARGEQGKPYFRAAAAAPQLHFNLSHDASVCVCVVAPEPVGVDVQARVPWDATLFERIATPAEYDCRQWFQDAGDLSVLWTRKEALVKRSGRGLSTPLQEVEALAAHDVITLSHDGWDCRLSLSVTGWTATKTAARLGLGWLRLTSSGDWCRFESSGDGWRVISHPAPDPPG